LAGAPFFLRRGGIGPLFVHFSLLLLKNKKEFPGIFLKKSSRENLKCVPAKVYSTTIPTVIPKIQQIDTKQNTDTKKTAGNTVVSLQSLAFLLRYYF